MLIFYLFVGILYLFFTGVWKILLQQHIHIAQTPGLNYFHRLTTQCLERWIQWAGMTVLFWMRLWRQLFPWCLSIKHSEWHSWSSLQGGWAVTAVRSWKLKNFYSDDGQKFIRQVEDKEQQFHDVLMHHPALQFFSLCICQHTSLNSKTLWGQLFIFGYICLSLKKPG